MLSPRAYEPLCASSKEECLFPTPVEFLNSSPAGLKAKCSGFFVLMPVPVMEYYFIWECENSIKNRLQAPMYHAWIYFLE